MKRHLGGITSILVVFLLLQKTTARYIFVFFFTSLLFSFVRMSERDEHHFMKDYLAWMKPGLNQESLTVFNFGYNRPLPFPSIALTPNSRLMFNLQTSGMRSQSRSSIIVIGQKYVNRFEDIMLKVDRIREDTQALPLAIFVRTKHDVNLMKLSSHPMRESPSLVGIVLSIIVKCSLSYNEAVENWVWVNFLIFPILPI